MMNSVALTPLAILLCVLPALSMAGDPDAGRAKAEPCLACHYADDFVGEAEEDILALIKGTEAPDSGHPARESELDEAAIADIAAFFARGE